MHIVSTVLELQRAKIRVTTKKCLAQHPKSLRRQARNIRS